jgi:cytochrome c553
VFRDSLRHRVRGGRLFQFAVLAMLGVAVPLLISANFLQSRTEVPPLSIPSNVAWTEESLATASNGDAFRGSLLVKRCDHCHGVEGFSDRPATPNLASLDRLAVWKQLQDFHYGKRISPVMQPIAAMLSARDSADLAAYYSMLPTFPDPQDNRSFPQAAPDPAQTNRAALLVALGDAQRGIPPCQSCHGPVATVRAAPSLAFQNSDYVANQLDRFASGTRGNDINMPMRIIAGQLSHDERHLLAQYYGAGFGRLPAGTTIPQGMKDMK